MTTPTITIEGKTYEMPRPKVRAWRKFVEFDEKLDGIATAELIEKRCEYLADVYGLPVEVLFDNLYVDDVVSAYRDAIAYLVQLVYGTLEVAEKNVGEGVETKQ